MIHARVLRVHEKDVQRPLFQRAIVDCPHFYFQRSTVTTGSVVWRAWCRCQFGRTSKTTVTATHRNACRLTRACFACLVDAWLATSFRRCAQDVSFNGFELVNCGVTIELDLSNGSVVLFQNVQYIQEVTIINGENNGGERHRASLAMPVYLCFWHVEMTLPWDKGCAGALLAL